MTTNYHELFLEDEMFFLLPQKAVFRPSKKQLILSDVHLGKATHFRKKGLAMPAQSHLKDIDMLHFLLHTWQPLTVLILGDLFHSEYNTEWLWVKSLIMSHPQINFTLVEGNHDILNNELYLNLPNLTKKEILEEELFVFSHHPLDRPWKMNLCGHIHPGLKLYGKAKQSEKLPCFYLNTTHFILPAFGDLTGLYLLEKEENARYYLVTGTRVIAH